MRRVTAIAWGILGAILTVIGVGGLPDDIRGWASFLNTLGHDAARWVVVFIGLSLIAIAAIPRLRFWEASRAERDAEDVGQPNWFIELEWLGGYGIEGLEGIRIRPHSSDGSTAKIYPCEVTAPDGQIAVANDLAAGSAIFGESSERLTGESEKEYLYPQPDAFANAPKLPLEEGTYQVQVSARSPTGPGRELLARREFRIDGGELEPDWCLRTVAPMMPLWVFAHRIWREPSFAQQI